MQLEDRQPSGQGEAGGEGAPGNPAATAGCHVYVVPAHQRRLDDVAEVVLGNRSRGPEIARRKGITRENPQRTAGQCRKRP